MYRVLIADDHPVVRKGMREILVESGLIRSVDEAGNGREALDLISGHDYDVVLLDISMPGMGGIEALEAIKKTMPSLPVLMLTIYPETDYAVRCLRAGASGYLTKRSEPDELVVAIRKIVKGGRYISPVVADILASNITGNERETPHDKLSNRELQVMQMIVKGKSNKEIAANMSLSPKTISSFRSRILEKLVVKNNSEIVQYAVKHRLFE